MFCRSLFVLLYFFFWPLCCLFFFDSRILITSLWYLQTLLHSINQSTKPKRIDIYWLCLNSNCLVGSFTFLHFPLFWSNLIFIRFSFHEFIKVFVFVPCSYPAVKSIYGVINPALIQLTPSYYPVSLYMHANVLYIFPIRSSLFRDEFGYGFHFFVIKFDFVINIFCLSMIFSKWKKNQPLMDIIYFKYVSFGINIKNGYLDWGSC